MVCRDVMLHTDEHIDEYQKYFVDESRCPGGIPSRIVFPESITDVARVLSAANAAGTSCVLSGARTGILGGAVPCDHDILISLERMNKVRRIGCDSEWFAVLEPGVTLDALRDYLHKGIYHDPAAADVVDTLRDLPHLWFPINPTEPSASVGGIVSTNASGARSYWYGATRRWVRRITVVLVDGTVLSLVRGECLADDGVLRLPNGCEIVVPVIPRQHHKNTAGYFLEPDMDAVDLFIGSEGTLGVIVEVELRLIFEPPANAAQVIYFPSDVVALMFLDALRQDDNIVPIAVEYFDAHALTLLREKKHRDGESFPIPHIPETVRAALYVECPYVGDDELEFLSESFSELLHEVNVSEDMVWAALDTQEHEAMRVFRHAVPEEVNRRVAEHQKQCPTVYKISTDCAVPYEAFAGMLRYYHERATAEKIAYVIVGHIGDGHVHVNLLPVSDEEVERSKMLYSEFAEKAVELGGTVAAEHGIGRLKRHLLSLQYSPDILAAMRSVKERLDPRGILGQGTLFFP